MSRRADVFALGSKELHCLGNFGPKRLKRACLGLKII